MLNRIFGYILGLIVSSLAGSAPSDSNFNSLRACAAKIYVIVSLSVCLCVYALLAKKRMVGVSAVVVRYWKLPLKIYCKP